MKIHKIKRHKRFGEVLRDLPRALSLMLQSAGRALRNVGPNLRRAYLIRKFEAEQEFPNQPKMALAMACAPWILAFAVNAILVVIMLLTARQFSTFEEIGKPGIGQWDQSTAVSVISEAEFQAMTQPEEVQIEPELAEETITPKVEPVEIEPENLAQIVETPPEKAIEEIPVETPQEETPPEKTVETAEVEQPEAEIEQAADTEIDYSEVTKEADFTAEETAADLNARMLAEAQQQSESDVMQANQNNAARLDASLDQDPANQPSFIEPDEVEQLVETDPGQGEAPEDSQLHESPDQHEFSITQENQYTDGTHFIDQENQVADEFSPDFQQNYQVDPNVAAQINQQIQRPVATYNPNEYAGMTGAEIDAAYEAKMNAPAINLPSVDRAGIGAGGENGLYGLYCPDHFNDPDKIAECAGRTEILSGWTKDGSGANWTGIEQSLRDGGMYDGDGSRGPTRYGRTGAADEYYEPQNLSVIVGPERAAEIAAARAKAGFEDPRYGVEDLQGASALVNSDFDLGPNPAPTKHSFEPSWAWKDGVTESDIEQNRRDYERAQRENDNGE